MTSEVGDRSVLINGNGKATLYLINKKTDKFVKLNDTKMTNFHNFKLYSKDNFFQLDSDTLNIYEIKKSGTAE